MTEIYIDADACPVRDETFRVATRLGLAVHLVSNGSRPIRPSGLPNVHPVIVENRPDAADDWIAERIGPGDICVTGDIPLAKRCLDRGAAALAHDGRDWTGDNIGSALAGREISRHLREIGLSSGGGRALSKADRSRFSEALDRAVVQARRPRPAPWPGRP